MGRPFFRRRLLLGAGLTCSLLLLHGGFVASPDVHLVRQLLVSVAHGRLNGTNARPANPLDTAAMVRLMEPGDIVLCHNPRGAYGYWTHAVLYVGGGTIIDSNDFVRGTVRKPLESYSSYNEVAVVRVKTSARKRWQAARWARGQVGRAYSPFSSLVDEHSEYCSKLVWEAFAKQNVIVAPRHHWLVPDDLAASARVKWIYRNPASPG